MSTTATLAAGITLLLELIEQSAAVSAAIRRARAEGRDDLTPEELAAFVSRSDAARQKLVDAINAKLGN